MTATDPALLRAATLLLPAAAVALAAGLGPRRPGARRREGALLAGLAVLPGLFLVNLIAPALGWWRFAEMAGTFHGIPVDLLAGWALLWGPLPILALGRTGILAAAAGLAWVDLLLMPSLAPLVRLGPAWLAGEAAAILVALLPALALGQWTRDRRRLHGRVAILVWVFAGLLVGLLPAVVVDATGGSLGVLRARPGAVSLVLLQIVALPALAGLSAVQEFAERGRGTPLPFDPPVRLVTSGLYRYVANPMQIAQCLLLAGLGLVLGSGWLAAAAAMGVVYGAGLAAWDERLDLDRRFGADWSAYRLEVPAWWPRLRPYAAGRATLFVARGCSPCAGLAAWLAARHPVGLDLAAAEEHPSRDLSRITYDPGDGSPEEEEGVSAVGRALEHLHLGWAVAGAALRLPGVRPLLQLVADAAGAGPRRIRASGGGRSPAFPRRGDGL